MNDYATKPFDKRMLLDVCAKWIDSRPLLLIADDTPDNQVLLTKYLRGSDYRLVFVSNGKDAVDAVRRHRVTMVLLDMNMPIMDGYSAAQAIRRLPDGESVPILALTSHDDPQERDRCLAAGCTDFLSKPVRRADFLARVAALLGHGRMPLHDPAAATALPAVRDIGDRIQRALALRDFDGIAALAASVGASARAQQLDWLAAASEELVNAAHGEDAERSAWWSEQLVARMSDALVRLWRSERGPTIPKHARRCGAAGHPDAGYASGNRHSGHRWPGGHRRQGRRAGRAGPVARHSI